MNNIIVIAPHPDDETLGCGGTIIKEKKNGSRVHWIIATKLTEGKNWSKKQILTREKEIINVSKKYNFDSFFNLGFSPTLLDSVNIIDIIKKIEKIFKKIKPNIIYLPNKNDIHSDHKIIFNATISCTKWFRFPYIKKILSYETLSESHWCQNDNSFNPNVFEDISPYLKRKIEIMKIYKSEYSNHPFPRSEKTIKSLAFFRGSMAGFNAAEAFNLLYEKRK